MYEKQNEDKVKKEENNEIWTKRQEMMIKAKKAKKVKST